MVCNGICDLFVMVLEFSVMVLLFFFSAGLPHCFYKCILSHFNPKGTAVSPAIPTRFF